MVCQAASLPTCDGLMCYFLVDMSDEDGVYCEKAAEMCFYEEVEEDGYAMGAKVDSLG